MFLFVSYIACDILSGVAVDRFTLFCRQFSISYEEKLEAVFLHSERIGSLLTEGIFQICLPRPDLISIY